MFPTTPPTTPETMEETIPRLVFGAAERFGDAPAIEDEGVVLSFRGLAEQSLNAARAFIAAGILPGDRVGVWAPNICEWVVAAIGIQMAGGVLVTLNTRMKGSEAAYILRNSGAKLLCTVGGFLGTNYVEMLEGQDLPDLERIVTLRGVAVDAVGWSDFLAEGAAVSEDVARQRALAVKPDDLSDFLFTSGTTGNPKGVMSCHGQNIRAFMSWSEVVGLREGERYLIVMPFFHSFGYKAGWLACLMRGATAIPHQVFDVPVILERIERDRINVFPGAPAIYQSMLAHPDLAKYDISSLRLAVTGAAPTPVELIHRMKDELGFETIITGYGLTETSGIVTMCRFDDDPEIVATTSGRAIADVEVKCVDAKGDEVPRGEPGEVWVRGYNVMRGYFNDPAETEKAIDGEGWLHTGDVAIMNDEGYVKITDRIKDMYIAGGFNCYPAEIESALYGSGAYEQVAVIGIPDERMGEAGMAFVVPAPGAEPTPTPESVIAWCRENMANYKVPRRVEIMSELPTNASGKVTKFVLRELAAKSAG